MREYLGRILYHLKRRTLYIVGLVALLAGTFYLVTSTSAFQGRVKVEPLPSESPPPVVTEPKPLESLSGSETVPEELKGKSGAHPAQASPSSGEKTEASERELILERPLPGEAVATFGFAWAEAYGDFRFHQGIDLKGEPGQEVKAACAGTVSLVEYSDDWHYKLVVDGPYGYQVVYAHLDTVKVTKGSQVGAGDPLGTLGQPGMAEAGSAPHLHLELRKDGQALDPSPYLK